MGTRHKYLKRRSLSMSRLWLVLAITVVFLTVCISMADSECDWRKAFPRSPSSGVGRPMDSGGVFLPGSRPAPPNQAGTATVGKGDLYALVVGIASYRDPRVPKLKVSDNDARAFVDFLQTQSRLFRNVHVKLMVNEQATKVEVEKYLNYDLPKAGKDDTVMIYFSGHGSDDTVRPENTIFSPMMQTRNNSRQQR